MQDEFEDFNANQPSPEEESEASFYFFINDLSFYLKSGKWGPRIWQALGEEEREIISNIVHLCRDLKCDDLHDWKGQV